MKLGEEKILGRRWVRGYRCPCGKLFEAFRIGFHAVIPAPDVCPNCGEPKEEFYSGSIQMESYIIFEKLWWIFGAKIERDRSIEFKPFPAKEENGIPIASKKWIESHKITRLC